MINHKVQKTIFPCGRVVAMAAMAVTIPLLSAGVALADSISHKSFGTLANGQNVDEYTLINSHGMVLKFITLGGCITAIDVPDRNGKFNNIVLGYQSLAGYDTDAYFLEALSGVMLIVLPKAHLPWMVILITCP